MITTSEKPKSQRYGKYKNFGIVLARMDLPSELWGSFMWIPYSVQLLMNSMTPLGYVFIRRFMIWFPICCLASSFIMQTHVLFDCSRQSIDEEELEFDDSSELSEELESPPNTNLNSPRNTGSTAETQSQVNPQRQQAVNQPQHSRTHEQPSEVNLPRTPSSWIDVQVPPTPPPDSDDRHSPN